MSATTFPGGVDVQSDLSIEHGTPEGYDAGCKGIGCPAGVEHGFSCSRAKVVAAREYNYKAMRARGASVAEIAAEFDISAGANATPASKQSARKPTTKTPKTKKEEAPMPSIAELAPELAEQITKAAVTAAADEAAVKPREKAAKAEKVADRLAPKRPVKRQPERVAEVEAKKISAPAEKLPGLSDIALPFTVGDVVVSDPIDQPAPKKAERQADPADLSAVADAAVQAVQALAEVLAQVGSFDARFRSSVVGTLTMMNTENAALRERLDRLEVDVKPAAAIARALASVETAVEA